MEKVLDNEFSFKSTDVFVYSKDEKELKEVEIFKTGTYRDKTYTEEDIDEMIANFTLLKDGAVGFQPPVRIGHRSTDDSVKDVSSVIGYITNLYRRGKSLFSDNIITEPSEMEKIKRGTLKYRSSEIGPYEDNQGNLFEKVLWGFGFVDIPQVEGMADVKIFRKDIKDNNEGENMEEIVQLKKEVEELRKVEKELEVLKKENDGFKKENEEFKKAQTDAELLSREEKIDAFAKDGKVIADTTSEKEFVKSLSKEQYAKYCEIKDNQPKLVELDKEAGTGDDKKPADDTSTEEAEKKEAVEKAEELTKRFRKESK